MKKIPLYFSWCSFLKALFLNVYLKDSLPRGRMAAHPWTRWSGLHSQSLPASDRRALTSSHKGVLGRPPKSYRPAQDQTGAWCQWHWCRSSPLQVSESQSWFLRLGNCIVFVLPWGGRVPAAGGSGQTPSYSCTQTRSV